MKRSYSASCYTVTVCFASLVFLASCSDTNATTKIDPKNKSISTNEILQEKVQVGNEVDIVKAFSLALKEVSSQRDIGKDGCKLTIAPTENGWRFRFFFNPPAVGSFVTVRVSKSGQVETAKGF